MIITLEVRSQDHVELYEVLSWGAQGAGLDVLTRRLRYHNRKARRARAILAEAARELGVLGRWITRRYKPHEVALRVHISGCVASASLIDALAPLSPEGERTWT